MTFISYAQNLEDVMLWRALKHIQQGFYVDVGANDPIKDSVTHAFYEMGWRGINIEPDDDFFQKLSDLRPRDINLKMAVGSTNGVSKFHKIKDTGLSTLNADVASKQQEAGWQVTEETVKIRPLDQILDLHVDGPIHFLKIDVEGFEKEVLLGLDLKVWRPWIILIEATDPTSQSLIYMDWEPLILDSDYRFAYFDGLNRFYVASEHNDLMPSLQTPPYIFDYYVTSREFKLQELSQQQTQLLNTINSQLSDLTNDLQIANEQLLSVQEKNNDLTIQLSLANARYAELESYLATSNKRNSELIEEVKSRNDQLAFDLEKTRIELNKVYQSRSYRITSPFRAIFGAGRILRDRVHRLSSKFITNHSPRFEPMIHNWVLQLRKHSMFVKFKLIFKKQFPGIWHGLRRVMLPSYTPVNFSQIMLSNSSSASQHLKAPSDDEQHFMDLFLREIKEARKASLEDKE